MDEDHPRACGVYPDREDLLVPDKGSSPRVRGLLVDVPDAAVLPRIIPARAGFTRCQWQLLGWLRDHPRACGVYPQDRVRSKMSTGSSPRVRGLR